jgi:hypothetical protein
MESEYMKFTKFLMAGVFALASFGANAANITSDQNGGQPLVTGAAVFINENIDVGVSKPFAHSVYFTTDGSGALGSASAVGLELSGVSGFDGPLTISLFKERLEKGQASTTIAIASIVGSNLSDIMVAANTAYSFVIEGTLSQSGGGNGFLSGAVSVSEVPLPAAFWLFGSGLVGVAGIARRRRAAA